MGIQYLNAYMKRHSTTESIKKICFKDLQNKVIAIDTSIYLYRFLSEGALLENMYTMFALFKHYNIKPIFVFDGKAPIEKTKILEKRSQEKIIAEKKYNYLKQKININDNNKDGLNEDLYEDLLILKKKFVRLRNEDILKVQELMRAFGIMYIEAEGEADAVCAKLVIKKQAYACLSEDMDLFVYGCPRVLRYISLINETVILYSLEKILKNLNMTFIEFKEICILSGTDYNYNVMSNITLHKVINYFKHFKKSNTTDDFYTWMDKNTKDITNIYELYNIYNMFDISNIILKKVKSIDIVKDINKNKIKELMTPEGFIFIK